MIKEALQYFISLKNPTVVEKNGLVFSDTHLEVLSEKKTDQVKVLEINTLTGLLEYAETFKDKMIFYIKNEKEIVCQSLVLDEWKRRECFAVAKPIGNTNFYLGNYFELEDFIIELQTKFVRNGAIDNLLSIL